MNTVIPALTIGGIVLTGGPGMLLGLLRGWRG